MNLPNSLTVGRIIVAPLIAILPFAGPWQLKLAAFVLYISAAVTDYFDGVIARTQNLVTDLGKLLDPFADKLLLLATLIPMYVLMTSPDGWPAGHLPRVVTQLDAAFDYAFILPWGRVGLPFWIVAVVAGREVFMTAFRSYAARRGVVIAAIGPAKWKTAMQSVWVGAAFFWFWAAAAATHFNVTDRGWWYAFAIFNGFVGTLSMAAALGLTLYSLWLYLRQYGYLLVRAQA